MPSSRDERAAARRSSADADEGKHDRDDDAAASAAEEMSDEGVAAISAPPPQAPPPLSTPVLVGINDMPAPSKARWEMLRKVDLEFSPDDILMGSHRDMTQTRTLAKLLARAKEDERAKEYVMEFYGARGHVNRWGTRVAAVAMLNAKLKTGSPARLVPLEELAAKLAEQRIGLLSPAVLRAWCVRAKAIAEGGSGDDLGPIPDVELPVWAPEGVLNQGRAVSRVPVRGAGAGTPVAQGGEAPLRRSAQGGEQKSEEPCALQGEGRLITRLTDALIKVVESKGGNGSAPSKHLSAEERTLEKVRAFAKNGSFVEPLLLSRKFLEKLRANPMAMTGKGLRLAAGGVVVDDDANLPEVPDPSSYDAHDFRDGVDEYLRMLASMEETAGFVEDRRQFLREALANPAYAMHLRISYVRAFMVKYSAKPNWTTLAREDVPLLMEHLVLKATMARATNSQQRQPRERERAPAREERRKQRENGSKPKFSYDTSMVPCGSRVRPIGECKFEGRPGGCVFSHKCLCCDGSCSQSASACTHFDAATAEKKDAAARNAAGAPPPRKRQKGGRGSEGRGRQ